MQLFLMDAFFQDRKGQGSGAYRPLSLSSDGPYIHVAMKTSQILPQLIIGTSEEPIFISGKS
jgi:hypothetical protein